MRIITIALALLVSCLLSAQTLQEKMLENPVNGASIYKPYSFDAQGVKLSAPPKGYKSFYISHFGRHGSRYQSRPAYFKPAVDCFQAAKAAGILTEKGEELYRVIQTLLDVPY